MGKEIIKGKKKEKGNSDAEVENNVSGWKIKRNVGMVGVGEKLKAVKNTREREGKETERCKVRNEVNQDNNRTYTKEGKGVQRIGKGVLDGKIEENWRK